MEIKYGGGKTKYGEGVEILLSGVDVVRAIESWLVGQGVHIFGARTVTVNGELCSGGRIYVDPSGRVNTDVGEFCRTHICEGKVIDNSGGCLIYECYECGRKYEE